MINAFFIVGLPRTRTSWMSNFLTYKTSFCFHEAIRLCYKIEDMIALFESVDEPNVGDADCRIIEFQKDFRKMFPNAKWIYIKRDIKDVIYSLEKRFEFEESYRDTDFCKKLQEKYNVFEKEYSPLTFQYDELDNVDVCEAIWNYCIPDSSFNYRRWLQLDVLKIDPVEKKMMKYHGKIALRSAADYFKIVT